MHMVCDLGENARNAPSGRHSTPRRARANAMATTSEDTKADAVTSERAYFIGEGPYALNEDDSAVDPVAFREALMHDAEKLKSIEQDEELAKALLGEDTGTMQEALKKLMAVVRVRTQATRATRAVTGFDVTQTRTDEERDARAGEKPKRTRFALRHAVERSHAREMHDTQRPDGAVSRHAQGGVAVRSLVQTFEPSLGSRGIGQGATRGSRFSGVSDDAFDRCNTTLCLRRPRSASRSTETRTRSSALVDGSERAMMTTVRVATVPCVDATTRRRATRDVTRRVARR